MKSQNSFLVPTARTIQYFWSLIRFSGKLFVADITTATVFWLSHTILGLILKFFFNFLTGEGDIQLSVGPIIGLQFGYTLVATLTLFAAILANTALRYRSMSLLIRNMLSRILKMPGSRPLPIGKDGKLMSSGQVVSTFRDDTNEIITTITIIEDVIGLGISALISFVIMFGISPVVTLGTFLPLGLIILIAQRMGPLVEKYRETSRRATAQVTGIIADMFHGTQTLKVGNAEERIVNHFRHLNDRRRQTMIRDKLLTELVNALSFGSMDIGMGLILLVAANLMYSGRFTIGDFALFAAYLWPMTELMRMAGGLITHYKQAGVSIERMETLMQGAEVGSSAAHHPVYLSGEYPPIPFTPKSHLDHFQSLKIQGLTHVYDLKNPDSHGVSDITFSIPRGSFTVVTGRIGSGKTTLLKTLLGLLPSTGGEIFWNGKRVNDPGTFLIPPRCAYTGQVPRLFSDTIYNNILLGVPEELVDLPGSLYHAVMDKDIAEMEFGLHTQVGPRGVRLSGGQLQRSAATRMFVRNAELLVFDDLSSALDVETESLLWRRLFSKQEGSNNIPTCLVVSHRRPALRQADQIILLKDGQLLDIGELDELLSRSEEMRNLWHGEVSE